MTLSEFRSAFRALAAKRSKDGVYLRGDASVPYGVVAQVLAVMRAAGVPDVGLVMEPEAAK
jgi:biopolymer transport protein ExbD